MHCLAAFCTTGLPQRSGKREVEGDEEGEEEEEKEEADLLLISRQRREK